MATLYIKYRPEDFSEVVGNTSAIEALSKAIEKKNHSHVYLLSGPPGTGKTTIARIMAKKLGASELDIRETNTASMRGIDTAREIIQQMRMMPMDGNSIVYILDECHRWTTDLMNAMLKPLEDTPDHVYFFLCTTDPNKLIKAIRSRCTEVKTVSLSVEDVYKIIKRINRMEEGTVTKEMLMDVAQVSEGSPRKAIVLLERLLSVDEDDARQKLLESGANEEDVEVIELCRLLLDEKTTWGPIASKLKALKEAGKLDEPETVRYIILGYMNSVLLNRMNPRAAVALEAFSEPTFNTGKSGITLACLNVIS